jgi:hypothetical protein
LAALSVRLGRMTQEAMVRDFTRRVFVVPHQTPSQDAYILILLNHYTTTEIDTIGGVSYFSLMPG